MNNNSKKISAVDVYLNKRKTREYVGQLTSENKSYIFTYDDLYLHKKLSIPLGPDLPLTKKRFTSKTLFPSFMDRIPSNQNPAYEEYCKMTGIDASEKDLLVLVATLGQKGPSSFIFSPAANKSISNEVIKQFRKDLKLSLREFGELFDFSPTTINRIENGIISAKEAIKRLEVYCSVPEAALFETFKNRHKVNDEKIKDVQNFLMSKINLKK